MLAALGLLPGAPASMDHSNGGYSPTPLWIPRDGACMLTLSLPPLFRVEITDSPKSVSSDNLFGGSDGYFAPGHYPNIDPYGPQAHLAKAQEAAAMDCDPSPSRHG